MSRYQDLLTTMFVRNVRIILQGERVHPLPLSIQNNSNNTNDYDDKKNTMHDLRLYWEYLSYLFRRMDSINHNNNNNSNTDSNSNSAALEQLELSYRDCLQFPLQPLQDHLESSTYEVFERDRMKVRKSHSEGRKQAPKSLTTSMKQLAVYLYQYLLFLSL